MMRASEPPMKWRRSIWEMVIVIFASTFENPC
jgi:hypothetical protein